MGRDFGGPALLMDATRNTSVWGGGSKSNQSLQQMKPPVTSLAGASAAPDVFTAEARC